MCKTTHVYIDKIVILLSVFQEKNKPEIVVLSPIETSMIWVS